MGTGLDDQRRGDDVEAYPLLLARTEELESLYAILERSVEESSRVTKGLRESNAYKDEVLGMVAHELRGPLTTILGNASILLKNRALVSPAALDAALEDIQTDARLLERLIANLLGLVRPIPEKPTALEPLDLHQLLRTSIDRHLKAYPTRQVRFTTTELNALVPAHQGYTEEVVANLLTNAEKYSPNEEPIEVRVRRDRDCFVISVFDRGLGVPPAEVASIFEPFYRSPSTANTATGLGLGLAVCKRLVGIQGGNLWVQPRRGGGSEFAFSLPIGVPQAAKGEPSQDVCLGL